MSYKMLYTFTNTPGENYPDGENPQAGLTLSGSTLYGTTYYGGVNGNGTIFSIGVDGSGYTNLLSFGSFDSDYGKYPQADLLIQGNSLYGTVYQGGANGDGMMFGISTNGSGFNDIYDFQDQPDGKYPKGGLCSP